MAGGKPKTPLRLEAERLCKELPNANTRTLARRLAEEFGVPIEQARSTLRVVRGDSGQVKRRKATGQTPRASDSEAAKSPKTPPTQLPESLAESWEPVEIGPGRLLVLSDIHVPYHVLGPLESALKFGDSIEPDTILLNGDAADFYSISRHQKDPRKRNFKREIELVRQLLRHIRERFPKARLVYKFGNHEERFEHWVWNHAPEVSDCEEMLLSTWLQLSDIGWEWVDDQRAIMAGLLPILHGHELGKGIFSPVNQARGAFMRMLDTVLVGHGHRSSSHTEPSWEHNETTCWSTGCLCELSPAYARINKWNWGFAWVEVESDKSFSVHNKRVSKSFAVRPA